VQSQGTAQTILGSSALLLGRSVESGCAPSAERSTVFHPLPPHVGQSARAMREE